MEKLIIYTSNTCGYCKQLDPIIDELIKEGHDILRLDLADKDNQGLKNELSKEYNKQCGTPWLIDASNGNQVCGFRDKETLEKWANGEEIPAPPQPTGPPPRVPFHGAPDKEIKSWKKEYAKWLKENDHLPDKQKKTADEILAMPRPKSDAPKPPMQNPTDEQLDTWKKEYEIWIKENDHLPNLQPADTIVSRIKQMQQQQQVSQQVGGGNLNLSPDQEARLSRIEQKLDKLSKHFGVK